MNHFKSVPALGLYGISTFLFITGTSALEVPSTSRKVHLSSVPTRFPSNAEVHLGTDGSILAAPQFHPIYSDGHSERVFHFHSMNRNASKPILPHMSKSNAVLNTHATNPKRSLRSRSSIGSQGLDWYGEDTLHPSRLSVRIQPRSTGAALFVKIAFATLLILGIAGALSWFLHSQEGEEKGEEKGKDLAKPAHYSRISKPFEGKHNPFALEPMVPTVARAFNPPPRTHGNLAEAVYGGSDGTWACTYRKAEGKQKEALELLFLCGIIPQNEFAESRVSQEHVDECVWIATHMLRQRSLNDWLARWVDAQQIFERSVTACFSARHDTHLTLDQVVEGVISSGPLAASSNAEDLFSRSADRDSSGQNLLMSRCREIMASRPHRKQEAEAASAQGSYTSSQPRVPPAARARERETALQHWSARQRWRSREPIPSPQLALSVTPTTSPQMPVKQNLVPVATQDFAQLLAVGQVRPPSMPTSEKSFKAADAAVVYGKSGVAWL